jgi:hypothetical protein
VSEPIRAAFYLTHFRTDVHNGYKYVFIELYVYKELPFTLSIVFCIPLKYTAPRRVPQLSGNGREDGQKGKYRREKSWDSHWQPTEKWS